MCLITVLPSLRPGPEPRPVRRRRERMNSLTDLREVIDVVIGVDTHVHTHSAAAVDTATVRRDCIKSDPVAGFSRYVGLDRCDDATCASSFESSSALHRQLTSLYDVVHP